MHTNKIDRRKALTVVAAVPAAMALGSTALGATDTSELARLIEAHKAAYRAFV